MLVHKAAALAEKHHPPKALHCSGMTLHTATSPRTHAGRYRHFVSRWSVLGICLLVLATLTSAAAAQGPARLFSAEELETTFPAKVYYLGKTAPVQLRNAAAVHLGEHGIFFAGLVDTSGYASGVQETYQMYLLLEQPTHFGSTTLQPGAYGAGFVGDKAVVMDIGGHKIAETATQLDDHMTRPRPLQLVQVDGGVRLYLGRRWCDIKADAK